jgi:hypothetical protein
MVMTGLHARDVVEAVKLATDARRIENGLSEPTPAYCLIANSSARAVGFILSTARRHKQWAVLRTDDPPCDPATARPAG